MIKRSLKWIGSNLATFSEGVLGAAAVAAGLLGLFGVVPMHSERAAQYLLTIGGIVALAFIIEAAERRRVMRGLGATHDALEKIQGNWPLREVPPERIGEAVDQLLADTSLWLFRGGSARFLRGTTLPTLSRELGRDVPVIVAVLDPRDVELCRSYAAYRAQIGRKDGAVSASNVQAEILATLYLAAWYGVRTRIRPRAVLLRSFSQLRYDIGSTGLLVTVADRSKPALYAAADSWFYTSVRDELEQTFHGNPEVMLGGGLDLFPEQVDGVTEAHIQAALEAMNAAGVPLLAGPAAADAVDFAAVFEAVRDPRTPNE